MSKLTQILSASAAAFAMATTASSGFAQTIRPDTKINSQACDEAYRGYLGAIAGRGMMHIAAVANQPLTGTKAELQAAEHKYHQSLRNDGIDQLTEAAGKVGVACGATPNQVLAAAKAKHAAKPTP